MNCIFNSIIPPKSYTSENLGKHHDKQVKDIVKAKVSGLMTVSPSIFVNETSCMESSKVLHLQYV